MMIGEGLIRNKARDHLHGYSRRRIVTTDIDLIYFDPHDLAKETEKAQNLS